MIELYVGIRRIVRIYRFISESRTSFHLFFIIIMIRDHNSAIWYCEQYLFTLLTTIITI